MTTINPYLRFNGNCQEAMAFYQKSIGGELTVQLVKETSLSSFVSEAFQDLVLHASLEKNCFTLMASDVMQQEDWIPGNNTALAIGCCNLAELERIFDCLAAGGEVTQPIHNYYLGKVGELKDKFGINWLLKY